MNNNKKAEFLLSGETRFTVHSKYKLLHTGTKDNMKPLILYLHGYKDNISGFSDTFSLITGGIEGYHLFIEGPYPVYEKRKKKNVEDWGTAWYLYDGRQKPFLNSLEKASNLIDETVKNVSKKINFNRVAVIGYSMGGYLAGYYALTRADKLNDIVIIGARIKTEILNKEWKKLKHLNILALHGKKDKIVDYKDQRAEINALFKNGINANFKLINQKHILDKEFINLIYDWLKNNVHYKPIK